MMRALCQILGASLCLLGIVAMILPIPFGIIIFVIGLMFLIPTTPSAAKAVRWARRRLRVFDRLMSAVTVRLPYPYRRILRETEIRQDW